MINSRECEVAERFLDHADEDSFTALFRVFSPQLISFFRKRGHEMGLAEDLSQEVMLTVYRRGGQVRDRKLFRAWLFTVARNAAFRHLASRMREAPTMALADMRSLSASSHNPAGGPAFEFRDWMAFLEPREREAMTLRFVEDWEYHEIATSQATPIGTVAWRIFNSKKKLAVHLIPRRDVARKAA